MNDAVDALDCATGLESLGTRAPLFVSSGMVVRTEPEVREMCDGMVSSRGGAHFDMDSLTVQVLSPDAAYVVREGNYTVELLDGQTPTVYMVMTTIWHRTAEGWRMVHLHESFLPPEAMQQQSGAPEG